MASLDSLSFKSIFRNRLFQDHDEDQVNLCLMTKSDENNKEDSTRKNLEEGWDVHIRWVRAHPAKRTAWVHSLSEKMRTKPKFTNAR